MISPGRIYDHVVAPFSHPILRSTHLVRQDQAQLESTIGNIGVSSTSDTGGGTEGNSGDGEEHREG